jgi:hypothetical protein
MSVSSNEDSLERRNPETNLTIQAAGLIEILDGELMVGDGTDNRRYTSSKPTVHY